MSFKALFAAIALSLMTSVAFAADEKKADAVELKADADAEVKAAIETAKTANDAAKKAQFEWFWGGQAAGKHLEDAIKAANDGKKEDAMKLAKQVEVAGVQGQEQAEKAKTAGPIAK
ncbi:hypothetical protein [Candidatus Thiothrix anitrata]|jgi:hypothetical protein|uniref:Uncharacterized protein n=1 Tax=Candidatus Thiothrix anitrata TaxID=2823902 RepID=A0ABX7X428_9GAMM|nr:hypothetical protein [Candidatus Thiothrix anitrata]QTR49558.1 hypothetical protein J8380_15175 [Candidatus Thiothrix anitrata]